MRVKGAKRAREAGIAAARALAATRGASGELEEPDAKRARKEPADEPGGASTPASTDSASTPAPAPAAGRAAGPASDAPIATGSVSTPAPAPTKPAVPTAEARDTDTLAAMRGIIEYVQHHLHARLASHPQFVRTVALHEQQPLTIRAATPAVRELMSYKHPWTPDEAAQSLALTGRYEAGGNIMWLNPFTTVVNALAGSLTCSEAANAAGPAPTWESVHRMADQFRVSQDPASTRVETGRVAKEKRLLFRAPVQVHAPTLDTLTKPSFPGTLELVSGHVMLYGWYLAVFEALDAGGPAADEWNYMLWQAGLTVSIHAQVVTNPADLAALSLKASNDVFLWERACGDSFPSFALKIHQVCKDVMAVKDRMAHVREHRIRYKGVQVVRNCLLGAFKYVGEIDSKTHDLIMKFERRFGKKVLTEKWDHMTRMLQACSGHAEAAGAMWSGSTSTSSLCALVIHYIWWALKHKKVAPGGVTREWLECKKDGTPGTVNVVLCKALLVSHIGSIVAELPESSTLRQELVSVLTKFENYTCFDAAFHSETAAEGARRGEEPEEGEEVARRGEEPVEGEANKYEIFEKTLSKRPVAMLAFLFDTFSNKHDRDLEKLCRKHNGPLGMLRWSRLNGAAGKTWRDLCRQLGLHEASIPAGSESAPVAGDRNLRRSLSDAPAMDDEVESRREEVEAERQETWTQTQQLRKKFAHVCCTRASTPKEWQEWFEGVPVAQKFAGKSGEAHRVFVLSADTFKFEGDDPWFELTDLPERHLGAAMKFMLGQDGPLDVLLFFDGRNPNNRENMAKLVRGARHQVEVWIVYADQKRPGRRVAWGSRNRETGWISLPVPRTQVKVKSREDGTPAARWAPSTHNTAWTDVPPVHWRNLPTITSKDKKEVFPNNGSASTPPASVWPAEHGVPVFWQETKPPEFWEDIIAMVDAGLVIDLSPGSGSVGRACLRKSVQYVAACGSELHRTWIGNALDREACELITKEKSPLFETDLAALIQTHFNNIIEQAEMRRHDDESDDDNDDGEDAIEAPLSA